MMVSGGIAGGETVVSVMPEVVEEEVLPAAADNNPRRNAESRYSFQNTAENNSRRHPHIAQILQRQDNPERRLDKERCCCPTQSTGR